MKKRKVAVCLGTMTLVGILSVGGAWAYFTDRQEAENVLTMGSVKIRLEEPQYPGNDDDEVHNIYPGQKIPKDPQITNTGQNPAYVRQEIYIPTGNVKVFRPEGGYTQLTGAELVTYEIQEGWVEQNELKQKVALDGNTYTRHVYNYHGILEPGEKTTPLFQEIQVINLIEGEIPGGTLEQIPVKAYAVQSQGFAEQDEAWEAYGIQNPENGWE